MGRSKFGNGSVETQVTASRVGVWYLVDFDIPDDIRDQMPVDAIGTLEMMFYCDPQLGHSIVLCGHHWTIEAIAHHPTRRNSRQEKRIPILNTKYIGLENVEI